MCNKPIRIYFIEYYYISTISYNKYRILWNELSRLVKV